MSAFDNLAEFARDIYRAFRPARSAARPTVDDFAPCMACGTVGPRATHECPVRTAFDEYDAAMAADERDLPAWESELAADDDDYCSGVVLLGLAVMAARDAHPSNGGER